MDTVKLSTSESEILKCKGYVLFEKIGEGAYTKVYLSTYKNESTKLACKIIDVRQSSSMYVHKFLPRELKILMEIKCPDIIHVHSIFRKHLKYYIFMRYAEKGDLMDYIMKFGAVPDIQSRLWSYQIGSALKYLHQLCIVHRDIKCENVLITQNDNIKLCDFGFSRYVNTDNAKSMFTETYCGSILYVSPEILKGISYNPFKSDIWSMGVVIFTMLNRMVPFNETNPAIMYQLQMNRKYYFRNTDPVLQQAKDLVNQLLQPLAQRRPTVVEILQHDWFTSDLTKEISAARNVQKTDKSSFKKSNEISFEKHNSSIHIVNKNSGFPIISKKMIVESGTYFEENADTFVRNNPTEIDCEMKFDVSMQEKEPKTPSQI